MTGLPRWLEALLGIGPDEIAPGSTVHFRFARFPEGGGGLLAALAVAALVATGFAIYRRERVKSRWRRIVMAGLRALLILAAVAVLLDPVLEVDRVRQVPAHTLVLVDDSLSMGLRDAYATQTELGRALARTAGAAPDEVGALTRAEIAQGILRNPDTRLIERLAARNRVEIFAFSDRIEPLLSLPRTGLEEGEGPAGSGARSETSSEGGATGDPPRRGPAAEGAGTGAARETPGGGANAAGPLPPEIAIHPRGPVTDIGGALRAAADRFAGSPVAGIVLVSDGRATAGEDVAVVAQALGRRGIPVHAIGIGDPTPAGNRRVETVVARERVFLGDPVAVEARISARGSNAEVPVEFRVETPGGGAPRVLERRAVPLDGESPTAVLHFEDRSAAVGRRIYSVWIEPSPNETVRSDNERAVAVEVIEARSRVLLVAGGPSYEYRYLKNLLLRDDRVELSAWLESADPEFPQEGDRRLDALPASAETLSAYEVVILCDPDPAGLPDAFGDLLVRFVGDQGGGLLFVAGEKYTLPFLGDPRTRPVGEILPVEIDEGAADAEVGIGKYYRRPWPILLTRDGLAHPALRMASDPNRTRAIWDALPGIYWSFPVRGPKPAASTLAVHPDPTLRSSAGPRVLLAAHFYGAGRVVFAGFDETWRWRTLAEGAYRRYWAQWIRHLAEGRLVGGRRAVVATDRETYDVGERVLVSARLLDASWRPLEAPSAEAEITAVPGGRMERIRLERDRNRPGWYRGGFEPSGPGTYGIAVGEASRTVRVEIPRLEFETQELDMASLRTIAEATGGAVHAPDAIGEIVDAIPDGSQRIVASEEPITLWDRPLTLAVLAALLIAEWILRKWSRLL